MFKDDARKRELEESNAVSKYKLTADMNCVVF